jgi:NitT/TauT family transport system substrate-binding protein
MKRIAALIWLIVLMIPQLAWAESTGLKKVSFIPQWVPQAQFAGYMTALDKGFYREVGLDVTMDTGGPGRSAFDALAGGKVTFCTEWLSSGIQHRANGVPVVNIAQITQRSSLMLIAKKKSRIKALDNLNGKRVALWGGDFRIQPQALFRKYNINPEIVPLYGTVNLFLKGAVDAISAMWYNEYHTIINSGLDPDELTLFFFKDLLPNFPEDGIYCFEDTYDRDPEMCRRFVSASLKGWLYAFEHPNEAIDIVMKYADAAHTETNKAHQRWMLARMQDLIIPNGDKAGMGKLKVQDFDNVVKVLVESGSIQRVPKLEDFYRGQ